MIERFPEAAVEEWPIHEFTYLDTQVCANTTSDERRDRVEAYWNRLDPDYVDGYGAESFSAMLARVRDTVARVEAREAAKTIVFCHGQIMRALSLLREYPADDDLSLMRRFRENLPAQDAIRNAELWGTRIEDGQWKPFARWRIPETR